MLNGRFMACSMYARRIRSLPVLAVTRLTNVYYIVVVYTVHIIVIRREQWCRRTVRGSLFRVRLCRGGVHSGMRHGVVIVLPHPPRWHTSYTIIIHKCIHTHTHIYIYIISYLRQTVQCNAWLFPHAPPVASVLSILCSSGAVVSARLPVGCSETCASQEFILYSKFT
jgi:hypothetical protein